MFRSAREGNRTLSFPAVRNTEKTERNAFYTAKTGVSCVWLVGPGRTRTDRDGRFACDGLATTRVYYTHARTDTCSVPITGGAIHRHVKARELRDSHQRFCR